MNSYLSRKPKYRMLSAMLASVVAISASNINAAQQCPDNNNGRKRALWGDLHVHTAYSLDAYGMGTRHDPNDAYRFAKGSPLTLADGKTTVKLDRPLDFAAVTDHSEGYGIMNICTEPGWKMTFWCLVYRMLSTEVFRNNGIAFLHGASETPPRTQFYCIERPKECHAAMKREWAAIQEAAKVANEPCKFTSLIGYEWTGVPNALHVHRNVIFANDNVPDEPYDFIRYNRAVDLWEALEKGCKGDCRALTIPHNMNLSNGEFYADLEGEEKRVAMLREKYDRVAEIFQSKGSSECLNINGDDRDPACDYEIIRVGGFKELPSDEQMQKGYARYALGEGLELQANNGYNPLQFGFIGSTDTHNATPGLVDEYATNGHYGNFDLDDDRRLQYTKLGVHFDMAWMNPGGLAAVWAEENTRESIFAALNRRETFATSGPRITVKFNEVSGIEKPCEAEELGGVPMGSTTFAKAPEFVVKAVADKLPLTHVQIVKGTFVNGKTQISIHEIKASNPNGDMNLCLKWADKDYDSTKPAYWYARVFEVPTKRWSKAVCEQEGKCDKHPELNIDQMERAWSSPIWNHTTGAK